MSTASPPDAQGPSVDGDEILDLLGIGLGPFNLSLAALADGVPGLRTAFLEQRPAFHWHPGLLIQGATLQVPFLADLVSLVDPTSRWSFLNHLRARERLFPFYFAERFHIERAEYDAYCRWVSESLPSCRFGHRVDSVRWDPARRAFEVGFTRLGTDGGTDAGTGAGTDAGKGGGTDAGTGGGTDSDTGGVTARTGRCFARHLALGVGTVPSVPEPLRELVADVAAPVWHSADYLTRREELLAAEHLTVVGSGQSGAEVFLDLLRRRPEGREAITWLARTDAFAPMEYSKLGLEQFTPDYTRYFHGLSEPVRDEMLPKQWQLHKGVSAETLGEIHDELYRRTLAGGWPDVLLTPGVAVRSAQRVEKRVELELAHVQQESGARLVTDAVVVATGYAERSVDGLLAALLPHLVRDRAGRPEVDARQRLVLDGGGIAGSVFVQNAERHTHGVGAPDLGLAAWRSAVILNSLTENGAYPLPTRTAFTTFGLNGRASANTTKGHGT